MFKTSIRKPVVFTVESNVWWSSIGLAYFGWRVHMSTFKSTHLSPNATAEWITSWMPSFSLVVATKTKTPIYWLPSSEEIISIQQRLFSAFLFYFIINSGYNGLVHMRQHQFIILSMNTKNISKEWKDTLIQARTNVQKSVFLSFGGFTVVTISVP